MSDFAQRQKDLRDSGIRALQELKKAGDIQAYGMGINTDDALEDVASAGRARFLPRRDALHAPRPARASIRGMAALERRGASVIIGAPFASGILVTGSSGGAHYGYAKASARNAGQGPRHRGRLQGAQRLAPRGGAAVRPRAPDRCLGDSWRRARQRSHARTSLRIQSPIPAAFWSDLKSQGLIAADAPVPEGR